MSRFFALVLCLILLAAMLMGCQNTYDNIASVDTVLPSETATEAATTITEASASTELPSTAATEPTKEESIQTNDGIRADFKAAMDSYEDFFESYCEFMKKYKENPADLELLSDYAQFMQQYTETMKKMEEIQNDNLSDAELLYYAEVNAHITKMLLEVA